MKDDTNHRVLFMLKVAILGLPIVPIMANSPCKPQIQQRIVGSDFICMIADLIKNRGKTSLPFTR